MEASQILSSIAAIHDDARRRGLFFQTCSDAELRGRMVTVNERRMVSFSSCSYLGLEQHPAVIAGVHDAVDRYGVQFSCSRGYLSAPIYADLEDQLSTLFGAHALVTPSTTMAHMIALPVLANEKDAIVLDHQAHHSIHMGANQARAAGTTVEMVRHDQLDRACDVIRKLAARCRTVWFATDGVFSMYGDLAPLQFLNEILAVAPNVRLYIDDAHGMSWAGRHGRGSFLSRMPISDRIVVATSFAKGFGAGGGCVMFSDLAERERVRVSGGPLVFSGPMQPPMMGAVLASAAIHLSPEIDTLQDAMRDRVQHVNARLQERGIRPIAVNESPIFFLLCGLPRVSFRVAERMAEDGVYVNCSVYPTVPMRRAGIRFTITAAHSFEELDHAIDRLAVHIPAVLEEEGVSEQTLAAMFENALPAESAGSGVAGSLRAPTSEASSKLWVETTHTIQGVDRNLWNGALGTAANCSWDAMAAVEAVYRNPTALPEHQWDFTYILVRDQENRLVGATFLTTLLQKDDMLSREEVSRAVEARRAEDPYFLTSKLVQIGSNLSEGNHMYLDRSRNWREALRLILKVADTEVTRAGAAALIVRDLPDGDVEVDQFMLDQGLSRMPMFDSHQLDLGWTDEQAWIADLDKKKRQQLRPILAQAGSFETSFHGHGLAPVSSAEVDHLFGLYHQLASRKLRLNVFAFPSTLLPELLDSPAWEFGVLRIRPEAGGPADGRPVAFWAAHVHDGHYAPLFCGIDDVWLESHGTYRAMLLEIIRRAKGVGMTTLHLGMDAELEKRRFGARAVKTCIYAQARDHYQGALLREIIADVGMTQCVAAK
ncbi:MAG: bifunctional aminotransferase class I/II-fold pyridoxal phosphate-dependent enzyme/GNAT family N-acetyltransferase [Pseudomonadota bacterium]|nr:bifunctional aminotransferase class I/II-fold pyridoxal phosphate-dependent enzyme/GNAT family N-acetyltransferase [Pseudomonadota bacterium]